MKSEQSYTVLLKRLWKHISVRRRSHLWMLLVLTIIASFAEILSIGAVLPFIGALTQPEKLYSNTMLQPFLKIFNITNPTELLLPLTIAFSIAALIAGGMRMLLLWVSTRVSFSIGSDLSNTVYRRTLYQPYAIHIARNSSEVINVIWIKVSEVIFYVLMPGLTLVSATVMIVAIVSALFYVIPGNALAILGCFGLIYAVIIKLTRQKVRLNSKNIAQESNNVIKTLNEGLGGIRDVLVDGSQESFCKIFKNTDHILRRAQGNNQFISLSPRFGMESAGTILIATLAYLLTNQENGLSSAIPTLAALALGLQRLLPALQQAFGSLSTIHGAQSSLQDTLDLLDQPLPPYASQVISQPISFKKSITLKDVSFRYSQSSPLILKNIDIKIDRGSRVGFVGGTGSGKSTMLDIIMGLLTPSAGEMMIDGEIINAENQRAWQAHIAHVPQSVFLTDNSIEENIAFGVPYHLIDHDRVRSAAEKAQLADVISTWPLQYKTVVGERGVQLSGGQRQRIGIARALYKNADVIIFDEATSALDNETESAVMKSIDNLSKDVTVLIIAHRINTLSNCDIIFDLSKDGISFKKF